MPIRRFKEHAEFLALRIIVTQILIDAFKIDRAAGQQFAAEIDRVIDTFEFVDGWAASDVLRGREYMRMAADWIISPAIRTSRGGRR